MQVSRRRSILRWSPAQRRKFYFGCFMFLCWFISASIRGDNVNLTVLTEQSEKEVRNVTSQVENDVVHQEQVTTAWNRSSEQTSDKPSPARSSKTPFWSFARSDRSGSAIQDMLMAHAYAFHQNMEYKGACTDWTLPQFQGSRGLREELLSAIGLLQVLPLSCPKDSSVKLQNRHDYIRNDTAIFTPSYQEYLHALISYPPKPTATPQIAVHIRRGDITPCRPRTRGYPRYLPNQHFLRLIERYKASLGITNSEQVVIFSESESFESFDPFREQGYRLVLDGPIGEVWKGMLVSDVVILSRSSFSLVPAVMTKGKVVYTPFWHEPLPHWDIVEEPFVNETLTEFRRLKATCPKKNKK